jgi:hypothetical protein
MGYQVVIPAKTVQRAASRNPEVFEMTSYFWIPDLTSFHSARPE